MRDIGYGADAARNPGDGQRTIHPQEFTFRRRYTDYTSIKERQDGLL
jgi:hypothetical protein